MSSNTNDIVDTFLHRAFHKKNYLIVKKIINFEFLNKFYTKYDKYNCDPFLYSIKYDWIDIYESLNPIRCIWNYKRDVCSALENCSWKCIEYFLKKDGIYTEYLKNETFSYIIYNDKYFGKNIDFKNDLKLFEKIVNLNKMYLTTHTDFVNIEKTVLNDIVLHKELMNTYSSDLIHLNDKNITERILIQNKLEKQKKIINGLKSIIATFEKCKCQNIWKLHALFKKYNKLTIFYENIL
jgi:hypothetical protein